MKQTRNNRSIIFRILIIAFSLFMMITCTVGYLKTVYSKEYFSPDSIEATGVVIEKTNDVPTGVDGESATEYLIEYIGTNGDTIEFTASDSFNDSREIGDKVGILHVPGDNKSGELDYTKNKGQTKLISSIMIGTGIAFLLIMLWNIRLVVLMRRSKEGIE